MANRTTTIRIALAGAQKVESELLSLGQSGDAALNKLRGVQRTLNTELQRTSKSYDDLGRSVKGFAASAAAALAGVISVNVARDAMSAALEIDGLNRSLSASVGGAGAAAREMAFLESTAADLGVGVLQAQRAYTQLAASMRGTSLEGEGTRDVFVAMQTALTVLGKSQDEGSRAFNALSQMASKGVVSMEELRTQLGDVLPGALNIAAEAMGMTTGELIDLVSSGELATVDFLPRFAAALEDRFAPALQESLATPLGQARATMAELGDQLKLLQASFGEGLATGMADSLREFSGAAKDANDDARTLGEGIGAVAGAAIWASARIVDFARVSSDAINGLLDDITGVPVIPGLRGKLPDASLFRDITGALPRSYRDPNAAAPVQPFGVFDTEEAEAARKVASAAAFHAAAAEAVRKEAEEKKKAKDATKALADAQQELKRLQSEGARAFADSRTEVEAYHIEMARLKSLLDKGFIEPDTFNRLKISLDPATKEAAKKADEEAKKAQKELQDLVQEGARIFYETRTETEKYAIEAENLKTVLDSGNITLETYVRRLIQIAPAIKNAFPDHLGDFAKRLSEISERAQVTGADIANSIGNAFNRAGDALTDFVLGGKASFADFANSIISDLVRIAIQQSIIAPLSQALSGVFAGFIPGAGGSAPVPVGHSGGMSEALRGMRAVNPMVFANAPRFHNGFPGMARDEIPAILQSGERVLNRRETRAYNAGMMRGGGSNVQVIVNTPPGMSARTREEQSDDGRRVYVDIEEVVARSMTSPKVRRQLAGSYGLRPFPGAR